MKTESNLSVDMAKFKVYDAWKRGIISEEDANKFFTFIGKGEFRLVSYTGLLKAKFDSETYFLKENASPFYHNEIKNRIKAKLYYADAYIKETTSSGISNPWRLADLTGVDHDWNLIFDKKTVEVLQQKDFMPRFKPVIVKYLEKDGDQYAELCEKLIEGSNEQE